MEPALWVGELVTPASVTQPAFFRKHGFGVIIEVVDGFEQPYILYVGKVHKVPDKVYLGLVFDGVRRYGSRVEKIKEGDLLVNRKTKKPYIVLEVKRYSAKSMVQDHLEERKDLFLLLSHEGRQMWKIRHGSES